jgi:hypothetical protein
MMTLLMDMMVSFRFDFLLPCASRMTPRPGSPALPSGSGKVSSV